MRLGGGNKQVFVVYKPSRFDQCPRDLLSKCLLGSMLSNSDYQIHAVFDTEAEAEQEAIALLVQAAQTVLENWMGSLVLD